MIFKNLVKTETNTENAAPEGISTTYFNCAKCEEDEIDAH
jgi:hypothetical protein